MNATALRRYLHERIPLTVAMGLEVREGRRERVVLAAPLAPNINHQRSAFGGSVAAIATLAAWSVLHLRCSELDRPADLVVRHSTMRYLLPIRDELVAVCEFGDEPAWQSLCLQLAEEGRARLALDSRLETGDGIAARFRGSFALRDRARMDR